MRRLYVTCEIVYNRWKVLEILGWEHFPVKFWLLILNIWLVRLNSRFTYFRILHELPDFPNVRM